MKLKYAIIATIIFNLVLISILLCRQYKEYHNRKHDYIRIIEASKAKIIKEIENTNFYSDTDPQIDKSAKNVLVFHFSMQACQPCLEGIREIIKSEFPDYAKNKNIIFFSNDIENRLRKNFLGKQIISSLKKEDKLPINKYATPLLFTTDSNNIIQNVFIPDKDNIESLRNYLKRMKIIFSNNR